jgi:hypothetical protein
VNNELERMQKQAVVASFKLLSWDFPRGTEESQEIFKPIHLNVEGFLLEWALTKLLTV